MAWRADDARPPTSTIDFVSGRTRANNALIAVSSNGTASAHAGTTGTLDLVVDVSGYFQ